MGINLDFYILMFQCEQVFVIGQICKRWQEKEDDSQARLTQENKRVRMVYIVGTFTSVLFVYCLVWQVCLLLI